MQEIYIENLKEIIRSKSRIEKQLDVKLTHKGKNVFIDGNADNEFTAIEILKAINLGFSTEKALQLKNENIILQTVNIKNITKRNDLERVRARIIGKQGKALKTLTNLTNCDVSLNDNQIGIIGDTETIEQAVQAVTSLIHGSKHGNVYARAERQRKTKRLQEKIPIKNELE